MTHPAQEKNKYADFKKDFGKLMDDYSEIENGPDKNSLHGLPTLFVIQGLFLYDNNDSLLQLDLTACEIGKNIIKDGKEFKKKLDDTSNTLFEDIITCFVCRDENKKTRKCTGCKNVSYCSRKCQEIDWMNNHRKICKK